MLNLIFAKQTKLKVRVQHGATIMKAVALQPTRFAKNNNYKKKDNKQGLVPDCLQKKNKAKKGGGH